MMSSVLHKKCSFRFLDIPLCFIDVYDSNVVFASVSVSGSNSSRSAFVPPVVAELLNSRYLSTTRLVWFE